LATHVPAPDRRPVCGNPRTAIGRERGVRDSSIPFSYLDNQLRSIGYAVEICFKIADAVKQELHLPDLKVRTLEVTSSTRIPLMMNGTIDLECGSITNNAERQKQVSFTNTYYLATNKFVSKKYRVYEQSMT
jgi:glutamate/aspartate transport system substrate-binding protein